MGLSMRSASAACELDFAGKTRIMEFTNRFEQHQDGAHHRCAAALLAVHMAVDEDAMQVVPVFDDRPKAAYSGRDRGVNAIHKSVSAGSNAFRPGSVWLTSLGRVEAQAELSASPRWSAPMGIEEFNARGTESFSVGKVAVNMSTSGGDLRQLKKRLEGASAPKSPPEALAFHQRCKALAQNTGGGSYGGPDPAGRCGGGFFARQPIESDLPAMLSLVATAARAGLIDSGRAHAGAAYTNRRRRAMTGSP